ncbi:MAG: hypothetical protein JXA93_20120 [Anaerolineae bacterium]|nr:hypothetical protein [Anaerolineae bacterium]
MRTLAGDERPTYVLSYPRPVRLARIAFAMVLAVGALGNWVLAWIYFLRPVVDAVTAVPQGTAWGPVLLDTLAAQPLRPLIAVHISLLLAYWAIRIVYDLLPELGLVNDGLAVHRFRRWQVVPWSTVHSLRIATTGKASGGDSPRRLVILQGRWTRWSIGPRLVSMMFGAGYDPAVLFTSDIRDFRPLVLRIYEEVKKVAPGTLFDDTFFSPPAALALDPVETVDGLVQQVEAEGWPFDLSFQAMGAVALGLIVSQLLELLLRGGAWWSPLAIILLIALEWIIGALYLYALGELLPGEFEFRAAGLIYPMVQIPRALLGVPIALLMSAGLGFLAALLGLLAVLWSVMLTALLVQRIYRLKSILPAVPGGVLQAVFQFIVLAIALTG